MAKILLVEDDTNLSEIYQARMEAEGYTVIAASDGESALALAAKEKPDLVLSDVMMPKISGFEMLDILRNTDGLKNTKVIMLTALGQAEDRTRAEALGADKYLVKSQVTLEDIVSAAQELLGETSLPTPAELAAPTVTAETPTNVSTAPVQSAPSESLPATTPAALAVESAVADVPATPAATISQEPATALTLVATLPTAADDTGSTGATTDTTNPADDTTTITDTTTTDTPLVELETPASPAAPAMTEEQEQLPSPVQPQPVETATTEIAPLTELMPSQAEEQAAQTDAEDAPAELATATEALTQLETPEEQAAPVPTATDPAPITSPDIPAPVATPALVEEPTQRVAHMPVQEPSLVSTPTEATIPPMPVTEAPVISQPAAPAPEVAATPVTEAPAEVSAIGTVETPPTAAAIDEKVVANAVDKLLAKSPSAPTNPDEAAAITPGGASNGVPHKKVISPINHEAQPTLQELLAKEEASETGGTTAPVSEENSANADTPSPTPELKALDDEAAAAELLAKAQAATSAAFSPVEEAPMNIPAALQSQLAPTVELPASSPEISVPAPMPVTEAPVISQPAAPAPEVAATPVTEAPATPIPEPASASPAAPTATDPNAPAKKAFDPNSIAL